MTYEEVFTKLGEILETDFRIPKSKITKEAAFRGGLGMDSLDAMDLIFVLKKTYALKVSTHDFRDLHQIDDVVRFIVKHAAGAKPEAP
jgi:acyl carrier protein